MFKLIKKWLENTNRIIVPIPVINEEENKTEEPRIIELPTIEYQGDLVIINVKEKMWVKEWVENVSKEIDQYFIMVDFESIDCREYFIMPSQKYIFKINNITFSVNLYPNKVVIDRREIINDEILEYIIKFNDESLKFTEYTHTLWHSTKTVKVFNSLNSNNTFRPFYISVEEVKEDISLMLEELKDYHQLNTIVGDNEYVKKLNNFNLKDTL